jgi:hypothetical protein
LQAQDEITVSVDSLADALPARRGRTLADRGLRLVWCLNLALLVGLSTWAYTDAWFGQTAHYLKIDIDWLLGRVESTSPRSPLLVSRLPLLLAATVCALTTALILFAALFIGPRRHRRTWSWLLFTGLFAAWLTLLPNWPELAWRGQQRRLAGAQAGFDALAQELKTDWPNADGERSGLGPFMAYPIGRPSMLLLLTTRPEVADVS